MKTPCLDCGQPATNPRCPPCRRKHEATHHDPRRDLAHKPYRRRRQATINAWVTEHGWNCPGWNVPAHPSTDLTTDHIIPIAAGGHPNGPLTVLCRSCNSRKAATPPGGRSNLYN